MTGMEMAGNLDAEVRRIIGILFQDPLLFPHLSVGANLAFGLPRRLRGRASRGARSGECLTGELLGLE